MSSEPLDPVPTRLDYPTLRPTQEAEAAEYVERIRRPLAPGDPRAHHFIPRWFLERFAGADKRLVRISLAEPEARTPPTSIEKLAQMRDWYTYDDVEVGPTVLVEKLLAEVDGDAKQPFERLSMPGGYFFPPSLRDREAIAKFLAFQAVRGPGHRRHLEAMTDLAAKLTIGSENLERLTRALLAADGNTNPTPAEIEECSRLDGVEADPGRAFLLGTMLESALRLVPVLLRRHIAVIRFPTTGLLLPDEPLHLYRHSDNRFDMGVGYLNADEIQLPINRSTALVLHNDDRLGDEIIDAPDDEIDEFNAAILSSAHSEVYAHPDDVYRLDRIELPAADRPVLRAHSGDFIRVHVDGMNDAPERRRPRRYRVAGQPPATT